MVARFAGNEEKKSGFLFSLQIPVCDEAQVNSSYSIERHSALKAGSTLIDQNRNRT